MKFIRAFLLPSASLLAVLLVTGCRPTEIHDNARVLHSPFYFYCSVSPEIDYYHAPKHIDYNPDNLMTFFIERVFGNFLDEGYQHRTYEFLVADTEEELLRHNPENWHDHVYSKPMMDEDGPWHIPYYTVNREKEDGHLFHSRLSSLATRRDEKIYAWKQDASPYLDYIGFNGKRAHGKWLMVVGKHFEVHPEKPSLHTKIQYYKYPPVKVDFEQCTLTSRIPVKDKEIYNQTRFYRLINEEWLTGLETTLKCNLHVFTNLDFSKYSSCLVINNHTEGSYDFVFAFNYRCHFSG